MVTFEQLKAICPSIPKNGDVFIPYLKATGERYNINTKARIAAFIAQIAHESMGFKRTKEIASGKAYEGRVDLGNTFKGDGVRYKGRGLIQVTGWANYAAISKDFGIDFIANPILLESPQYATLSAGWFWNSRDLNKFADLPDTWRSKNRKYTPFQYITFRINGGMNGFDERLTYYNRAMKVL